MKPKGPQRKHSKRKGRPARRPGSDRAKGGAKRDPSRTFKEAAYLKRLANSKTLIQVRTKRDEDFTGWVAFYDSKFIRLTRTDGPNLLLYKSDIKYFSEQPQTGEKETGVSSGQSGSETG